MSVPNAVFVLIHGGWHNHSAWDRLTPMRMAQGFEALSLDLPGAGIHAIAPKSLGRRPFDAAASAAERSPVALSKILVDIAVQCSNVRGSAVDLGT